MCWLQRLNVLMPCLLFHPTLALCSWNKHTHSYVYIYIFQSSEVPWLKNGTLFVLLRRVEILYVLANGNSCTASFETCSSKVDSWYGFCCFWFQVSSAVMSLLFKLWFQPKSLTILVELRCVPWYKLAASSKKKLIRGRLRNPFRAGRIELTSLTQHRLE